MGLPKAYYMRSQEGAPVGPLALQWLEILFDARVIDGETPLSESGRRFRPLMDWPELFVHLDRVKQQLAKGQHHWETFSRRPEEPETGASELQALASGSDPILGRLIRLAALRLDAELRVEREEGLIQLSLKDGRLIGLETADPKLDLQAFLLRTKLVTPESIAQAIVRAPSLGNDLGAALVALGFIPGDAFVEALKNWALSVLGALVFERDRPIHLDLRPPQPPTVPLDFHRFDLFPEAVRVVNPTRVREALEAQRSRPLMLAPFEHFEIEDFNLKSKELRILNAINGVRSLEHLARDIASSPEMQMTAERLVFFGIEAGIFALGRDPLEEKERKESEEIEKELSRIEGLDYFQILGVDATSDSDEIRNHYTELARRYHPDGLRLEAHPPLRKAREAMFTKISEAFDAIGTPNRRRRYQEALASGSADFLEEEKQAQRIVQAETSFKKAEILIRVRKYEEAIELLDHAIELYPEPDYQVVRHQAAYLAEAGPNPQKGAREAVEKVLPFLEQKPSATTHLVLAQLYKALGKMDDATRHYQRVLTEIPNHSEAASEVRLAQLRKGRKKTKRGWLG
ncbi:MAG: DnaJ domain-containing protein [Myxococcota bacterium]